MNGLALLLSSGIQNPVLPDTVVMVAARDGVDVVYAVAAGSIALTFLAVFAGLAFALWQIRKLGDRMEALSRKVAGDPGVESLRRIATNVEAISHSARREVEHLSGSVSRMSDRLAQVSERMEERIEEFNALMAVIQEEAEGAFVDTASAARGVREGLNSVGHAARTGRISSTDGGRRRRRPAPRPEPDPTSIPVEGGHPGLDES